MTKRFQQVMQTQILPTLTAAKNSLDQLQPDWGAKLRVHPVALPSVVFSVGIKQIARYFRVSVVNDQGEMRLGVYRNLRGTDGPEEVTVAVLTLDQINPGLIEQFFSAFFTELLELDHQ